MGADGAGELAAAVEAAEPSPLVGEFAAACVAGAVAGEVAGAATVAGAVVGEAAGVPTA